MSGHAERSHARLSPSGAHRWLTCTPSARLEEQFPQTESPYAEEGTLAHELCEIKVNAFFNQTPKRTLTAQINKLKKREHWHDEMIHCADLYLDYITASFMECDHAPYVAVERRVDMTPWVPESFGIADCIIVGCNRIHVIDYKHGAGVPVSAKDNPQLMLYALGAYHAYNMLYDFEEVRLSIVQPRVSSEVSTWELELSDLIQWGAGVKERAVRAMNGEGEFNPTADACRFCRAKQTCRARADKNLELMSAKNVFAKPDTLTLDEIGGYLQKGADLSKWVDELKAYALSEALNGNEVAGWKAVEGRGSRDWTDRDAAFKAIVASGTPEAMLYETKPLSLAEIEKQLGKKQFETIVGEYVHKKPGKPALVSASDKREAITNNPNAKDVFT